MENITQQLTKHPDDTELLAYLENPAADEFFELRKHLSYCNSCRTRTTELHRVDNNIANLSPTRSNLESNTHLDDILLNAFHDQALNQQYTNQVKRHLEQCADCQKTSLLISAKRHAHAATTKARNDSQIIEFKKSAAVKNSPRLRTSWKYIGLAVASISFIAYTLTFLAPPQSTKTLPVASSYVDDERVVFYDDARSMVNSFAGDAAQQQLSFPNLTTRYLDDTHVKIRWPEVAGAENYTLELYNGAIEQSSQLISVSSETNHVEVDVSSLLVNKRYFWLIRGKNRNGHSFIATGGLILNEAQPIN